MWCGFGPVPCPLTMAPATFVLRAGAMPDGTYSMVARAYDLSAREVRQSFPIRIDHTAPAPPLSVALVGGDGWRAHNRFHVSWVNPSPDRGAAAVGAEYRLCPADAASDTDARCVTGRRDGSKVETIDDISVPSSGVWRLRLALRDEAGHVDLDAGATVPALRFDADPPQLAFLPSDPADPARVRVRVRDDASGIARVAVEARRKGEDSWRALSLQEDRGLVAALLDDDAFPSGTYEIRAHAVDAVGNERTITAQPNGRLLAVQLPVRDGTTLTAGVPSLGRAASPPGRAWCFSDDRWCGSARAFRSRDVSSIRRGRLVLVFRSTSASASRRLARDGARSQPSRRTRTAGSRIRRREARRAPFVSSTEARQRPVRPCRPSRSECEPPRRSSRTVAG